MIKEMNIENIIVNNLRVCFSHLRPKHSLLRIKGHSESISSSNWLRSEISLMTSSLD